MSNVHTCIQLDCKLFSEKLVRTTYGNMMYRKSTWKEEEIEAATNLIAKILTLLEAETSGDVDIELVSANVWRHRFILRSGIVKNLISRLVDHISSWSNSLLNYWNLDKLLMWFLKTKSNCKSRTCNCKNNYSLSASLFYRNWLANHLDWLEIDCIWKVRKRWHRESIIDKFLYMDKKSWPVLCHPIFPIEFQYIATISAMH